MFLLKNNNRSLFLVQVLSALLLIFQYSEGKLVIESTPTGFTVSINSTIKLIEHDNSQPAFSISETIVNYIENQGNFIINETTVGQPVILNQYTLENKVIDGQEIAVITLKNINIPTQGVEVRVWEGQVLNGVDVSCSFSVEVLGTSGSNFNRILMRTPSSKDEHLYGMGEQYTHFDLKGHNFTIWTREQGVGRNKSDLLTQLVDINEPGAGGDYDYSYWPQSSFISAQSRYLFGIKSNAYTIFDFQTDNFTQISFQSRKIEGYFVQDDISLLSLVGKVSQIFGRQPELPEWVYNGAILGVQGGTSKMLQYLDEAEENGVAVSAMWVQDWSGKISTTFGTRVFWNWKWNSTWYPRLDEVIKELRETKGIRVLAYINPSLNSEGELYKEGDEAGVFLRQQNMINETYLQDFGDFFCGTVDLWNDQGVQWYKNILRENMLRFGFSGWMADFGEYTPLDSATVNNTVDLNAEERHNQLPYLWAKLNRDAVEEEDLLDEVMFWTRSGSSGASGYTTMLWGGDQNVDWSFSDGLPSTITAGLSAGMSGMGLFHFDIGGYTTLQILGLVRSKELLLRSAEYAVFGTPIMRTHEGNQPAANHQVYTDVDTWQSFGRLTQIYKTLSNYTRSVVRENAESGYPVMRPLFLHYESDEQSFLNNYEFLYGRDLLVAPVLHQNAADRELYLPPDEWIHLWDSSDTVISGGRNVTVLCPLGYPPVFFRASSSWVQLFRLIRNTYGGAFNF